MADDRDLVVLIAGRRAGVVAMDTQGRFALRYDEEYRAGRNPTPLSLSMPLAQSHHGDGPVRAFLWGLLPDNEQVLQRWARTYQVSAGNPFALLRHVGEDCAGASSTPWPTTGSSGVPTPTPRTTPFCCPAPRCAWPGSTTSQRPRRHTRTTLATLCHRQPA